jgi:hypothetical protein
MSVGRRKTRRGGNKEERLLRHLQIKGVQKAREAEIDAFAAKVLERWTTRPGWKKASRATIDRLEEIMNENKRLLAKGKGRRVTRRSRRKVLI